MNYNKIEIIENTTPEEAKRKFFIVSDKHLTELNLFSVYHGFLSFEIDHYTDTEKKIDNFKLWMVYTYNKRTLERFARCKHSTKKF
jgi:hypothetical protein